MSYQTYKQTILNKLTTVYGETKAKRIAQRIEELADHYHVDEPKPWVTEKDIMLITYGDSIKKAGEHPAASLHQFLNSYTDGEITAVHLLPFYPYSSDDGFSVIDYYDVNPDVGDWDDIQALAKDYDLMFDGVINHISKESDWFKRYLAGDQAYEDFFIEADPKGDYASVTRPRALPLLTKFETTRGDKYVWTTFSDDQIDLNYRSEEVFVKMVELLLMYAEKGARFIRLDAIGFMWKELGTSCMHLDETHTLIQVMRLALDAIMPGTVLITETNVPHQENISYFGDGHNEAQMVYQFPLPPLTLHSFISGQAKDLTAWAQSLEETTPDTTFFNFLASHDGVGVRPVEGLLQESDVNQMVERVESNGGYVSFKANGDGTKSPYELNINYLDAITLPEDSGELKTDKFIAAQSILLSMAGVPGIYIHSLLGSQNDQAGVERTGRYRSINREKLDVDRLTDTLDQPDSLRNQIFTRFKSLIRLRQSEPAFHPNAAQTVNVLDPRLFSLTRGEEGSGIQTVVNVSNEPVDVMFTEAKFDLVSQQLVPSGKYIVEPYQVLWLKQEG